jgi:hypothetical protein
MREVVAVLLMAALLTALASLAFADAGGGPVSPPLMYAGIRG